MTKQNQALSSGTRKFFLNRSYNFKILAPTCIYFYCPSSRTIFKFFQTSAFLRFIKQKRTFAKESVLRRTRRSTTIITRVVWKFYYTIYRIAFVRNCSFFKLSHVRSCSYATRSFIIFRVKKWEKCQFEGFDWVTFGSERTKWRLSSKDNFSGVQITISTV